jgi:hypothetical protein
LYIIRTDEEEDEDEKKKGSQASDQWEPLIIKISSKGTLIVRAQAIGVNSE